MAAAVIWRPGSTGGDLTRPAAAITAVCGRAQAQGCLHIAQFAQSKHYMIVHHSVCIVISQGRAAIFAGVIQLEPQPRFSCLGRASRPSMKNGTQAKGQHQQSNTMNIIQPPCVKRPGCSGSCFSRPSKCFMVKGILLCVRRAHISHSLCALHMNHEAWPRYCTHHAR
jgi:hypothetical protein